MRQGWFTQQRIMGRAWRVRHGATACVHAEGLGGGGGQVGACP
jgi:hypothetical protein